MVTVVMIVDDDKGRAICEGSFELFIAKDYFAKKTYKYTPLYFAYE